MTALWPTKLSLASTLFEVFCIGNWIKRYSALSMNLGSWSMQGWKWLNWWITGKFNWKILARWWYQKWRIIELFYRRLRALTTVELSSVLKAQIKFPIAVAMLKNWLSYPNVIVEWNLHHRWTTAIVGETWETLAKEDAVGEALCWTQVPIGSR